MSGKIESLPSEVEAVRYDVLLDPMGNFVIWDCRLDLPAMHEGEMRISRSHGEAQRIADRLNAGHDA